MADKLQQLEAAGAQVTSDNHKAAAEASIVFIAVKPAIWRRR
jgi:pyrroline-5-carboxylate reductase